MPEYSKLSSLKFEVQVRTAFEHTWAEIEHGLNYKSERALPQDLMRRLHLLAGGLEIFDRELSNISALAKRYQEKVVSVADDSVDEEIRESTIIAWMENLAKELDRNIAYNYDKGIPKTISDLKSMGIKTASQLRNLLRNANVEEFPLDERNSLLMEVFVKSALYIHDLPKAESHFNRNINSIPERYQDHIRKTRAVNSRNG